MRRSLLAAFALCLAAFHAAAGPLIVGPIPVGGSGSFVCDSAEQDYSVDFGGSNGVDTVQVSYSGGRDEPCLTGFSSLMNGFGEQFTAFIDNVGGTNCCGAFGIQLNFFVGYGDGFVDIGYRDINGYTLLASAKIIGYVNSVVLDAQFDSSYGRISILPTPEPASVIPVVLGLFAFLARGRIRSKKRNRRDMAFRWSRPASRFLIWPFSLRTSGARLAIPH
jgi:hypothetical protein